MAGNVIFRIFANPRSVPYDAVAFELLAEQVRRVTDMAENGAKSACPFDTGELRGNIKQRAISNTAGMKYAVLEKEVYIEPSMHTSSKTTSGPIMGIGGGGPRNAPLQVSNPALADILNEGFARDVQNLSIDVFRKRRRGMPRGGNFTYKKGPRGTGDFQPLRSKGDPTAGWIEEAQDAVEMKARQSGEI